MDEGYATAAWLTFKLASLTAAVLLALGLPLSYWLATTRCRARVLVEAIVALPIVLPPTVIGFYLLMALGPRSPVGRSFESLFGHRLPFSFSGLLVGSVLFNLPFAVRPFTSAFAGVDLRLVEASWCLGVSRARTLSRLLLPLAWPGVLTGLVLAFAHTVGEFGVVLMLGGNIPGETRTLSVAIYDDVQSLNYTSANHAALWLMAFSFGVLCAVYGLQRRVLPL